MSFIPFIGIVAISATALAGCSSSSGTIAATGTTESTRPTTPAGKTDSGAGNAAGWALTAPKTIFGFAQIQPSAAMLDKIRNGLTQHTTPLGVSGTQVIAVYDDPTHDVYLIFAGYDGSGFDPARMGSAYRAAPVYTTDGAGDHIVINTVVVDPGAHGGTAGCESTTLQSGGLAGESTLCSWMTSTTLGSITYYPKPDHQQMVFGTGPEVMGKVMRDLRDQVEHRS